jgi:hypothetical protein
VGIRWLVLREDFKALTTKVWFSFLLDQSQLRGPSFIVPLNHKENVKCYSKHHPRRWTHWEDSTNAIKKTLEIFRKHAANVSCIFTILWKRKVRISLTHHSVCFSVAYSTWFQKGEKSSFTSDRPILHLQVKGMYWR